METCRKFVDTCKDFVEIIRINKVFHWDLYRFFETCEDLLEIVINLKKKSPSNLTFRPEAFRPVASPSSW